MQIILIALLVSLITSFIEAVNDYNKIFKGEEIQHTLSLVLRGVLGFMFTLCLSGIFFVGMHDILWSTAFLLIVSALQYWITFDLFLNWMRGLPWDYIGKTSEIDKASNKQVFYVKVSLYFLFIVNYLLFFYA